MRQKLQNSKGYAESSEFLPALGLFIFKKKSVATSRGKLDPSVVRLITFFLCTHTHIYGHQADHITLLICIINTLLFFCINFGFFQQRYTDIVA